MSLLILNDVLKQKRRPISGAAQKAWVGSTLRYWSVPRTCRVVAKPYASSVTLSRTFFLPCTDERLQCCSQGLGDGFKRQKKRPRPRREFNKAVGRVKGLRILVDGVDQNRTHANLSGDLQRAQQRILE